MSKMLLVLAHPDFSKSLANKEIVEKLKKLIPNIEIDDLYKLYPNFKIDVKKEQEKLKKADTIILQFPMFWYNAPSLMRKWFEDVLEHGFAYGAKGKELEGKKLIVSMTMGSPDEVYKDKLSCENLSTGFSALADLCKLKYVGVFHTGGVMYTIKEQPDVLKKKMEQLGKHAEKVAEAAKK